MAHTSASLREKRVVLVHTSFAVIDLFNKLFDEMMPHVKRIHIVEHSLIQDILDAGHVTPEVMRRMVGYFLQADSIKPDAIFSVCSTVGDVVDVARTMIRTPIVKIDDAMAAEAVERGTDIGVLATLPSTLDPTCRLLERVAAATGKRISVKRGLVPGAFDQLIAGNTAVHDQLVRSNLRELAAGCDLIVLAQSTMARVVEAIDPADLLVPVLSSPRSGVLQLKQLLETLP
jgi:aspartate/glutamate racemase